MSAGQAVFSGWMEFAFELWWTKKPARERRKRRSRRWWRRMPRRSIVWRFPVLRNSRRMRRMRCRRRSCGVLRHRDRLDEVRDRRVWLIRIVWNVVLDRKRRMKTRPETDDVTELVRVLPWQGLTAEEMASAAQHHAHVLGCVDRLPEKERQVLVLSAFEELPSVEIAEVLGITESSVRSRLFRARNLLAGMLDHARTVRPKAEDGSRKAGPGRRGAEGVGDA